MLRPEGRTAAEVTAAAERTADRGTGPTILDLNDPYFDGQTFPEALSEYEHVHSTTGVCVKEPNGNFCRTPKPDEATTMTDDQPASACRPPAYDLCACGDPRWRHHLGGGDACAQCPCPGFRPAPEERP